MTVYSKDAIKIYTLGAALLLVTGFVFWDHVAPEWKGYQQDFREVVAKKVRRAARRADSGRLAANLGQRPRPG
jgi:hypothetical protein